MKSNVKLSTSFIVGLLLSMVFVSIYYSCMYVAAKKTWDTGTSVVGVAVQKKKWFWRDNVEVTYEADGKEVAAKVSFIKKDYDKLTGGDKNEQGKMEVRYTADKPENGVVQPHIAFMRRAMINSLICVPILCIYLVLNNKLKKIVANQST